MEPIKIAEFRFSLNCVNLFFEALKEQKMKYDVRIEKDMAVVLVEYRDVMEIYHLGRKHHAIFVIETDYLKKVNA